MKTATTISIDKELLSLARGVARSQKRSLSAQLEKWLEERFAPACGIGSGSGAEAETGALPTVGAAFSNPAAAVMNATSAAVHADLNQGVRP